MRVVGAVISGKEVDEQICHEGAIIGNHCMTFGEFGVEIVESIHAEMKK